MSAPSRRSCWAGVVAAAAFSLTIATGLVLPGIAAAAPAHALTTSGQVPSGSNGVNHNDTPLPPNPNCTTRAGTSGTCSSPQPFSTADQNNVGANTTSSANAYVSTRNGAAADNGNGNGNAVGKPCAGCVGKADNKFPPGQAPNGPTDHNNGYECDGNNGIGQTNPAHTGCQSEQLPPPKCDTCQPPPPPCQCTPPPTICLTQTGSGSTSAHVQTGTEVTVGVSASGSVNAGGSETSPNETTSAAPSTGAETSVTVSGSTGATVPTSVPGTTGSETVPGAQTTTAAQGATGSATTSPSVLAESGTASPSASVQGTSGTATGALAATASPSSGLAFTGFSAIAAAAGALVLVAGGFLLVRVGRRRTA